MESPSPLSSPKIVEFEHALKLRKALDIQGKSLVLTNGCFDILHPGHVSYLQEAAKLGDELWIALNADESVRALKGPSRPINDERARAFILSALSCVSRVFVFRTPRLTQEILGIKPDHYTKAGDYTLETLNPEERGALESVGAQIHFIPFVEGLSTTNVIEKIRQEA